MFNQLRSIAVDGNGRIYALDIREANVKVFDQNGKYIRTIGKKGQGPGEFNFPLTVLITSQNEIVVEDFRSRLVFFSLEGEFKRNLSTSEESLTNIVHSPNNAFDRPSAVLERSLTPDAQMVVFPWDFCFIIFPYPNQPEKKSHLPISREVEKIMGQNFSDYAKMSSMIHFKSSTSPS